jgi:hypothetical protein
MYYFKAVDKRKMGYRCGVNNIVINVIYGLFFLLMYTEIIFVFNIELIVGSELVLV